jgi:hypothetical protein
MCQTLDELNVHEWFRAVNNSGAQIDNSFPLAIMGTKNTRNRSLLIGQKNKLPNTVPFY